MKPIYSLLLALVMLLSGSAMAQWAELPAGGLDSRTLRIQSKVESLYKRGDYKRAHFIYSNELSRQGDKYAQYMTGYMYLMGQGVAGDPVRASAWYRLAAERRVPEFIAVRDQVLRTLNQEQRARSDEIYVELRKEYSDLVIVMGLLVEDLDGLKAGRTGSRLRSNSGSVMIYDPNTGVPVSADHIRSRAVLAAQKRLDFVTSQLDIDPIKVEQANQHMDDIQVLVGDYLEVVDDTADGLYASP